MLLASTDLYLTPYRSREQIVSGALTFAVAAGCPVVSTPYFYAEDLLASGAGVLVPFDDAAAMADGGAGPARPPRRAGDEPGPRPAGSVPPSPGPGGNGNARRCWPRRPSSAPVAGVGQSRPSPPAGPRRSARPPAARWSTTSASSSTPTGSCRTAPPATASTTWPGWRRRARAAPRAQRPSLRPDAGPRPRLPAARLGPRRRTACTTS